MKQRIFLSAVLISLAAALFAAQRRPIDAPVGAQALLYLAADSERELTRLPAKFTRISDSDEIEAGNKIAASYISRQAKLSGDDLVIQDYVAKIGQQVAAHAHRKLPYQFHYIPERYFINAFALPGGHVFIGAGLIERMQMADELASVLGHEIEHADHYHCAERLQTEAALRKVPFGDLLGIPVELFQAGYSKDQELEADREGVRVAALSGYSANGAIRVFEMFDALSRRVKESDKSPQQEMSRVAGDIVSGYFRSHPPPAERISQIKAMIAREPALVTTSEKPLETEYIFLAWQSSDLIAEEKFEKAASLASRSLQLKPGYTLALQGLAESDLALEHGADATQAYRALLAQDTAVAGQVESWAEERAQGLINRGKFDSAILVAKTVLELQSSQPKLLRLLALAQTGNADVPDAAVTANALRRLYPDVAVQFAGETEQRAVTLMNAKSFAAASRMAKLTGALAPGKAIQTLGDAEFAQAHFADAAAAYQELLKTEVCNVHCLQVFGDALGSARPRTAAHELEAVSGTPSPKLPQAAIRVEVAGLKLMAGDNSAAQDLRQAIRTGEIAPEAMARLGWWYFRAHRLDEAEDMLQQALRLRPNDGEIQNNLAWVELEQNKNPITLFDASRSTGQSYEAVENRPSVGIAITQWQQKMSNEALQDWPSISREQPQWLNPEWRKTIYPPHVAELAGQIEAEQQRREIAKRMPPHR